MAAATAFSERLKGKKGLLQSGQRQRVLRILSGNGTADDFQTLLLELRFKSRGRNCFGEIADFVAHRDVRDRGAVATLVQDIFISARVFIICASGNCPSIEDARAAALANIRLTTDDQIAAICAMTRHSAQTAANRAADMLARGLYPTIRDQFVFDHYGNRLKWHPAFLDHEVVEEWVGVLRDNGLLMPHEEDQMRGASKRLILYILSLLHGSKIELKNKDHIVLQAGFFNKERRLEVKAYLTFSDMTKPVHMPLCVFLTELRPEGTCDPVLINCDLHGWDMPIQLSANGLLSDKR